MRALAVLCVVAGLAGVARATPTAEHPLEDAAGVVPDADEPALEAELNELRAAGVELGVMVVRTTGSQSIEAYARAHAVDWSIGSGPAALFVLAIDDRRSRIEVSDALRAKFPVERAQSILDNIRGYLRTADYTGAIRAVIAEVKASAAGVAPDLESPHPQVAESGRSTSAPPPAQVTPAPKRDYTLFAIGGVVLGALTFCAFLWAKSRLASRATLTGSALLPDRSIAVETILCVFLILGWILYIAIMVAAASNSRSSSSSSWGSSGGGGWSGGGASSSW